MRFCSRALAAFTVVVSWTLPLTAGAHHSFAAHFEMGSMIEIEGRVTDLDWVNPHIKFQVAASDGQSWEVEAGPVNLVSRMGIEKSMLAVGSTLRVRGNPGRGGARTLWVSNVLLQNGTELVVAPGALPHWGADAVGDASAFFAVADCEVPGMPFAMMSPYPIEIVNQGEWLLLRGEAYDLARRIHLGAPPAGARPSPLSTSRGRFAGDELVVETDGIDYHSYGDLGPAQSDQSKVLERFKLVADGLTLDYEIMVNDPVMLAEPWAWGGQFVYREGAELRAWNCGADRG